jgi:hypothetical protein
MNISEQTFERLVLCPWSQWGKDGAKGIEVPLDDMPDSVWNEIKHHQARYKVFFKQGETLWVPIPDDIANQMAGNNNLILNKTH